MTVIPEPSPRAGAALALRKTRSKTETDRTSRLRAGAFRRRGPSLALSRSFRARVPFASLVMPPIPVPRTFLPPRVVPFLHRFLHGCIPEFLPVANRVERDEPEDARRERGPRYPEDRGGRGAARVRTPDYRDLGREHFRVARTQEMNRERGASRPRVRHLALDGQRQLRGGRQRQRRGERERLAAREDALQTDSRCGDVQGHVLGAR